MQVELMEQYLKQRAGLAQGVCEEVCEGRTALGIAGGDLERRAGARREAFVSLDADLGFRPVSE